MKTVTFLFIIGFSGMAMATACEDPRYQCPSSSTCCLLDDGSYGCCPIKNAVCCEDHVHCCPEGTTCDVSAGQCLRDGQSSPIHKKHAASRRRPNQEVICPDHKSKCPSGTTCCEIAMGSWGCCPMPNAVCCEDRMHCCPNGYQCDSSGQRCVGDEDEEDIIPMTRKFPSTPIVRKRGIIFSEGLIDDSNESLELEDKVCGRIRCPSMSTCCEGRDIFGGTSNFKCCPLSEAICCDGYCCPLGFVCSRGKTCEKMARSGREEKIRLV